MSSKITPNHTRLEALYEVSRALNSSLELVEALRIVIDAAIRLTGAERGFLMLADEPTQRLSFRVARSAAQEEIDQAVFEVSQSVIQEVARSGQAVVTLNAQTDPRFEGRASIVNYLLRSIMAVPLRAHGRLLGVLYVDSKTRDVSFNQNDLELLGTFADQAATALLNAQLFETQKRDAQARQILLEIARAAQAASTQLELAQLLARTLPGWLGCDRCGLFLWDVEAQALRPAAFSNPATQSFFASVEIIDPAQLPLAAQALRSRSPVLLSAADLIDGLSTEWLAALRPGPETWIVPIRSEAEVNGVLTLDNAVSGYPFSALTQALVEPLGEQLATAFQRLRLFETSQRQLKELTVLNAVAVAATESGSVAELTTRVMTVINQVLSTEGFGVMLVDEAAGMLRLYPGQATRANAALVIPLGQGVVGHVAATGRPLRVSDVSQEPRYLAVNAATRSELCVPLKVGERVIGVLNAESVLLNAFTASDERLLVTIAGQLATAIEKQRLLETERQQRELAEALSAVGLGLTLETDLEEVLGQLMEAIARVVPYDTGCVLVVEEDGHTRTAGARGYDQFKPGLLAEVRAMRFDLEQTANLRQMVATGQPVIYADVMAEPGWVRTAAHAVLRSWVGAPVMVRGRAVAFLSLDKQTPGFYQTEHAQRLAAFAGYAALALQNIALLKAAEQRAAELDAVRTASLSLTSSLDVREVLHAILQAALNLLPGSQDARIFFYQHHQLIFGAALWADGRNDETPTPRPNGLTATVARTGEPLVVADMSNHPLFVEAPHGWRGAILGLPLRIGARVVGVMNVSYPAPRPVTEAELRILRLLGEQAAAAIENARLFDATRKQVAELTSLHAVALAGAESTTVDILLERVTRILGDFLDARHCGVLLLDKTGLVLQPHSSFRGQAPDNVLVGEGVIGRVASGGRPARIADLSQEKGPVAAHLGALSELCVPLKAGERVIGVIDAASDRREAFTEDHERLLATVAGQLTTAFEKARLFESERDAREQAETLREVASLLSTPLEREPLLGLILEQLARLVKYDSASVMLLQDDKLSLAAHRGFPGGLQILHQPELQELRHVQAVLQDGQPLLIADTHTDDRWQTLVNNEYIRCWLGVPLLVKGRPIGILNLDHAQPGYYTVHDAEIALTLSNQAAAALERLRLLEETQQRERELAILLDVAQAVASSLDLDAVLQQVSASITETLRLDACSVSVYDPVQRMVTTLNWYAQPEMLGNPMRGSFRLEDYPLTARVMNQDDLCIVHANDPELDPAEAGVLQGVGYQTLLMVSVRANGRPVGLLELYASDPERAFSDTDLRLARATADQTGVAIENARLFQAEREQRQLAEALRAAAISLSASLDFDAVLDRLLDQIIAVVPYDSANVMLVDPLTDHGWVVRQRGYERFGPAAVEATHTLRLKIAETPTLQTMIETGQALVIPDVAAYPGWQPLDALRHIRSWAGAPVLAQGTILAFFGLDNAEAGFYQPKHADRLAAFAGQAALALQNARLFEAERRRVAALTTLHDIGLDLSARLDLPSLLTRIVAGAAQLLRTQRGAFYRLDLTTEELDLTASLNVPTGWLRPHLRLGQDVAGRVALTGETLVVADYRTFAAADLEAPPLVGSALGVPIQWQGQLQGVLTLLDEQPQRFGEADVDIVRLFADRAAIAIENVRLYAALDKERQRLELLVNLSQNLASTLKPQEVALRAMDLMRAATGAFRAVTYLNEPTGLGLHLMEISGYGRLMATEVARPVALGQGVVGLAAQTRRPVVVPDVRQDARWAVFSRLDDDVLSAVVVPLLAGDELIGVLSLLGDRLRFYQEEHIPLLAAAAVPVALALQNARLFEAEASRVHYLTVLNEITRSAVTIDELPALLQTMVDCVGELTGADDTYLTLWDEARQQTVPAVAFGPDRETYATYIDHLRPGVPTITAEVLNTGQPLWIEDDHASPYVPLALVNNLPNESLLGLPLIAGDQKLGAVIIGFTAPHAFSREEIQRAEQAAGQIGLALARARLFDATRRHADELAIASDLLRELSSLPGVLRNFPKLAGGLKKLAGCAYAVMALLTAERQALVLAGLDEITLEAGAEMRVPITREFVAPEVLEGSPELVPNVAVGATELDRWLARQQITARVTLPLRAGAQVTGLVMLFWETAANYGTANFALLNQLADALALAVEKDRLLDETLRRAAELEALTGVSAALRSVETSHDILNILVDRSQALFLADSVAIQIPTVDARHLVYVSSRNLPADALVRPLPIEASIAGRVYRTGQSYRSADLATDALAFTAVQQIWAAEDMPKRSALYAPLRSGEDVIGVLVVTVLAPRVVSEADLRLLNTIAEVGGSALQRARVLETLEQRVEARTRELANANEQLQELDRLKDQFVSNVSHELRTPLTAIKLHLGLLERRGAEMLPRYLPVLQRETERLRRLIEDLLDLSRLRARSTQLSREPHRLETLLDDVLALHGTRAEERGINLLHEASPDLPAVALDYAQMMQVFTNLIANAVTYTSRGGHVTVRSRRAGERGRPGVAVAIHNDGPPIPPEDLPHLFTRFYRGKTALDTGEPGTGLGLAICKEIVERHAGVITVTSAAAEGTTFEVWLPLDAPDLDA